MAAHTQGYCGWREGKQRDLRREGLDIDDKTGLPRSIKVNKGAHQGETFRLNSQLHGIGYGPSIIMLLCWGLARRVPQYVSPEPPRTNRQRCAYFLTNTGFSNPHRYKKFRNDAHIPHNAEGAGNIWLAADRGDLDLVKQYVYVFLECVTCSCAQ